MLEGSSSTGDDVVVLDVVIMLIVAFSTLVLLRGFCDAVVVFIASRVLEISSIKASCVTDELAASSFSDVAAMLLLDIASSLVVAVVFVVVVVVVDDVECFCFLLLSPF